MMKRITVLLIFVFAFAFQSNAQYCTSSGTAGTTFYVGQTCVSTNFPNCENCCATPGNYTDETGRAPITNFTPSGPNASLLVGYNTNAGGNQNCTYAAYIDLNQDGDFEDAGELVTSGSGNINFPSGGGSQFTVAPTIPITATNGTTRMRFIVKNGTAPVSGPCENGFNGETEDWPVSISGAGGGGTNTPPNAVCTNYTANLDAMGNVTIMASNVDGGSNDAEGGVTLSVSPNTFNCSNIGDNTVTLTVTDTGGLMDTCTATVTVVDVTPPVWTNPGATIPAILDATGTVTLPREAANPFIFGSDACDATVGRRVQGNAAARTFTCADIGGSNSVTVRLRDNTPGIPGNNNDTFITVGVIVQDITPPVAICQDITVQLDASGNASVTAADIDNGSSDACGIGSLVVSPSTFDCSNIGPNTVTLTVTDVNGNMSTCTATVTVEDMIDPVITCAANGTRDTDSGANTYTVQGTEFDPTFSDNCLSATVTNDLNNMASLAGAMLGVGDTTINWTVDDGNGQMAMCSVTITVLGNVNIVGGNLVYNDVNGIDDTITIVIDGANYRISDPSGGLSAGMGATQDGNDVLVPIASITGDIQFNTADGDDLLTVDFDGGDFTDAINYNGGGQTSTPGDILVFNGTGNYTSVAHNFVNENDGSIDVTGNSTITYTGLEPVIDNLNAADRVFTFLGGNEIITLDDGGILDNQIDSTLGEMVDFTNPTNSLSINSLNGADFIQIQSLDTAFDANLSINANAAIGTVQFINNAINLGSGNLFVNTDVITIIQNITTTGNITLNSELDTAIFGGAIVQTTDGTIGITAGNNPSGLGFIGFSLDTSAQLLATGTGNINISGTGGVVGNSQIGIRLVNNSLIQTNDGAISLIGNAGGEITSNNNVGIINGSNASIQSIGTGSISLIANAGIGTDLNRGIIFFGGANASTNGGGITATANGNATTTGSSNWGFELDTGASLVDLNGGDITVNSTSGAGISVNRGIYLRGASNIQATTGNISLTGTGNGTGNSNIGIFSEATSTITATDGNITLQGTGANATGNNSEGVTIINGAQVTTTGTGSIGLTGDSGTGASENKGIILFGNPIVRSNGGGITMTGTCLGTGLNNFGVTLFAGSLVEDINGGDITINGTGGTGNGNNNTGVFVTGSTVNATGGMITISGLSNGQGSNGRGVAIESTSSVSNTGTGGIMITGTGSTSGVGSNHIGLYHIASSITAVDGDITMLGNGGISPGFNAGYEQRAGATVTTTGSGAINVTANGGSGTGVNVGMNIFNPGTTIASNGGGVTLNGTAGASGGSFAVGVNLRQNILITDTSNGTISINGTGAPSAVQAPYGIYLDLLAEVIGADGNITMLGNAGTASGTFAFGVAQFDSTIQTTGTGAIQITANGGNAPSVGAGMQMAPAFGGFPGIETNGGGVTVNATAGIGSGNFHRGLLLVNGAEIRDLDSGNITLNGTGGVNGDSFNNGILILSSSVQSTDGTVSITGNATGSGSGTDNTGMLVQSSQVTATGTGGITLNGTAGPSNNFGRGVVLFNNTNVAANGGNINMTGNGVATTTGNDNWGLAVEANSSVQTTGIGNITLTGTGGAGTANNFGTYILGGSQIVADTGTVTINGTSTATGANNDGVMVRTDAIINNNQVVFVNGTSADPAEAAINFDDTNSGTIAQVDAATIVLSAFNGPINTLTGVATNALWDGSVVVNGTLAPGQSPGQVIIDGDLNLNAAADIYQVEFDAYTTPGTDFDQVVVNGTVTVDGATLELINNTGAPEDDCSTVVLIDNDGADAIIGIFNGLPEGASIVSGGITGKVSYVGGDGNDFVLILDDTPPAIACPADQTVNSDPGICGAAVFFADPIVTDNCGIATVVQTMGDPSGSIFPVGNTIVEFTATDINGNSNTCSFVITVIDIEAPTIECTDLTVDNDPGVCGANVDFPLPVVMDNCPVPPATIAGFTTLGSFNNKTFYLSDNALGGIATFDDAIANGGSAATVESLAENTWLRDAVTAAGESGPFRIGYSDNDEEGTFTWQSGSLSTFTNWLPGQPDNAPVNADFVTIGAGGPALWRDTRNIFQFRYVLEIPGVLEQTAGPAPGEFFPVGDTTVSFTYTDSGGNTASCSFIVTVNDAEAPVAVCQDITLALDGNGMVTLDPILLDGGSTDNCAVTGYAADITEFDCSNVGDNTVTLIVTDDAGNTASCTATVTIIDDILPTITCMDITLPLGPDGTASITPDDVATFDDNCGINTTAVDIEDFDCSDIGTPVTVMVFVEDVNGNLNACMAVVTVVDELGPEVTCPADQTVDPGPGNLQYELPDYWANGDATATDNCTDPVAVFTQDPAPGTLLEDGTYTITLCAQDEFGNESCCEFELIVESVLGSDDFIVALDGIGMYPNPASDVVTISNPNGAQLDRLSIYDATGRLVVTHNINGATTDYNFNVSNLSSATYLVVIEGPQGSLTKQLIRE